jgi:hypothetical protein
MHNISMRLKCPKRRQVKLILVILVSQFVQY